MKGYLVGVAKMLVTSPRVKINVTAMIKPMEAFRTTDHIIAFGNVAEASLISSAVYFWNERVRYMSFVDGTGLAYTCARSSHTPARS